MEDKILEIIELLIDKSRRNLAEWDKIDENAFCIEFGGSRLIVNNYFNYPDQDDVVNLLIYNRNGDVIYTSSDQSFYQIRILFDVVKDSYYNISDTLNEMLKRLRNTDESIGGLPF